MVSDNNSNLMFLKVGDRVSCSGDHGTIKYVGPVDGYPSIWLGIDWDESDRGKHNGCVNGKQYFKASGEKSGSFVRPEKVQSGVSAASSIKARYGKTEDENTAKLNEQQLLRFQQTINAPFLEMVGFDKVSDKQRNFSLLQVINLRLQNISTSGLPNELKELCPNVKELDISKNLLTSWTTIFDICTQLEYLTWLNVSENLMAIPENYSEHTFPNLKTLVCGSMRLSWDCILKFARIFPNLEELRAPFNNISHLTTPEENDFRSIETIDFEGNPINSWSEVCKLAALPLLEHLILENIGLTEIKFDGADEEVDKFVNLKKLTIIDNKIDNWESIGELNMLKSLEDLKFIRNPILETETVATRQQLIIAKIANLKMLNGTVIKSEERRGAEYDYLKKYALEWFKVKDSEVERESFLKSHNRYLKLLEAYGTPEELELVPEAKNITSSLVVLELKYNDKVVKKKLPRTMLVQKLMLFIQKLFSLHDRPKLTYISSEESNIEIDLKDEGKEIGYYSLLDGDQIIVKL